MNGTVTIITGAAQGIGRAIAELLAEKGGDVAIFDVIDGSATCEAIRSKAGAVSSIPSTCPTPGRFRRLSTRW